MSPGRRNTGFPADVRKSAVAIVAVELRRASLHAPRPAENLHAHPIAGRGYRIVPHCAGRKIHIIRNEEIEPAVAIVIEKRATGAPSPVVMPYSSPLGRVREGSIAIVMQ